MQELILIVHVLMAVAIVGLVLLQHGKGADVGATFGGGASNTIMGSQGSKPFLFKFTAVLAAIFFATSIALTYFATHGHKPMSHGLLAKQAVKQTASIPSGPVALQIKKTATSTSKSGAKN